MFNVECGMLDVQNIEHSTLNTQRRTSESKRTVAPMVRRLASAMSLLVFAVCLIAGIEADNPLSTTLSRALVAMAGTMVVALIVGAMGQKMLDEHVAAQRAKAAAGAGDAGSSAV